MTSEYQQLENFRRGLIAEIDAAKAMPEEERMALRSAAWIAQSLRELASIKDHVPTVQEMKEAGVKIDPSIERILTILEKVQAVVDGQSQG